MYVVWIGRLLLSSMHGTVAGWTRHFHVTRICRVIGSLARCLSHTYLLYLTVNYRSKNSHYQCVFQYHYVFRIFQKHQNLHAPVRELIMHYKSVHSIYVLSLGSVHRHKPGDPLSSMPTTYAITHGSCAAFTGTRTVLPVKVSWNGPLKSASLYMDAA